MTLIGRLTAVMYVCWIVGIQFGNAQQPHSVQPSSAAHNSPKASFELLESMLRAEGRMCSAAEEEIARRGNGASGGSGSQAPDAQDENGKLYSYLIARASGESPESILVPNPDPKSDDTDKPDTEQQTSPVEFHFDDHAAVPLPHPVHSVSGLATVNAAHAACFDGDPFPSAKKCQACHPGHYREWSVSPHAYGQLSPVFNAMSSKLIELNNGTLGDFCIRCHTPVGMALGEPIVMSNMDRHPAAREGITCVVCHRINQNWGKGAGRQALVAGGVGARIYGPTGNRNLANALADPDTYGALKTKDDPEVRARLVHSESVPFFALTTPATCGACHDVFAPNGFRLEDAFSEFKSSPAARQKHQNCQDCHMGQSPGVASGYAFEPVAKLGNTATAPRKRTNHMIIGPDYSIIHPGLFPHNPKAVREEDADKDDVTETGLATMREWLQFDYKSGWGTEAYESDLDDDVDFPKPWKDQAKRFRARDILNEQFELLDEAKKQRHQILSAGYKLGRIILDGRDRKGLQFHVNVSNGTDGHGVPTGFDAERLVFLRVTVLDRNDRVVFISGDLDPNGDVRDSHSFYVHNGDLPIDRQLFSLQSRFITRNVRGGEREQILNVPFSLDPLPYTRPATRPFTVLGRPVGARKHKQNLEVAGVRPANYRIGPSQLSGCGPYQAHVELIAGMVPINLVKEISSVGFDYGMSAREIADAIVDGHIVVDSRTATFNVDR